jgi:flagellin
MSSINTNISAMTALQSLNKTQASMEMTQKHISTGFRVGSAEDNAAYWSIATTMRSDNSAMSTVKDALGLGAATIDVAYTATNSAIDVSKAIKDKLVAARQPGVDRSKIQSEVGQLQNQLKSIGDSAVFSGQNWLSTDSAAANYNSTKSIVASFTRSSTGGIAIGTISIDTVNTKLYDTNAAATQSGIVDGKRDGTTGALSATGTFSVANIDVSGLTDSAADLTKLEGYISGVDKSISEMTSSASSLGATKQRVNLQSTFVGALMDAVDRGISTLVDADMTQESTKLQALQVQQQLGVQALSIANQQNQSILSLFR